MNNQEIHILELSKRYQLGVTEGGFVLYELKLNDKGTWERVKGAFVTSFEVLLDKLLRLELKNEDINTLEEMKRTLEAIRAEFREAVVMGRSW